MTAPMRTVHYGRPDGRREPSPDIGQLPAIMMAETDHNRLRSRLTRHWPIPHWQAVEFLVSELLRATVVDDSEIPAATVTMHSVVEYRDEDPGAYRGAYRVVQLVYPEEEPFNDNGISVLTPLGAALIGLSEGQSVSYLADDGRVRTITVRKILYQPETHRRMHG